MSRGAVTLEFGCEHTDEGFIPVIRIKTPNLGTICFWADIATDTAENAAELSAELVALFETIGQAGKFDMRMQ